MINILSWLALVVLICYLIGKLSGIGIGLIDFFADLSNRRRKH